MGDELAHDNPLFTSPAANLNPDQDALRWRAVMTRLTNLENALRRTVKFNDRSAPGGSEVSAQTINAATFQVRPTASVPTAMTITSYANTGPGTAGPIILIPNSSIQLAIQPQVAVYDVRDSPPAYVLINDEQQAFDAGGTQRTYSHVTLVNGGTMASDIFTAVNGGGGLGIGARLSRRAGIQWGGAGNWGVDVSFVGRYHSAPSSVTLTTVTDSLNGGTKSVTAIDYFGFMVQVAGAAGGGFTLNRWTASGGT